MAWFRQQHWAEFVAALLFALNIVLLGLPGLLIAAPIATVFSLFGVALSQSDAVWPVGIWTGSLMPIGFALAAMRGARLYPTRPFEVVSWGILGYLATGIVAAVVLLLLMAGP